MIFLDQTGEIDRNHPLYHLVSSEHWKELFKTLTNMLERHQRVLPEYEALGLLLAYRTLSDANTQQVQARDVYFGQRLKQLREGNEVPIHFTDPNMKMH